jgi:hypothetical protein
MHVATIRVAGVMNPRLGSGASAETQILRCNPFGMQLVRLPDRVKRGPWGISFSASSQLLDVTEMQCISSATGNCRDLRIRPLNPELAVLIKHSVNSVLSPLIICRRESNRLWRQRTCIGNSDLTMSSLLDVPALRRSVSARDYVDTVDT